MYILSGVGMKAKINSYDKNRIMHWPGRISLLFVKNILTKRKRVLSLGREKIDFKE